RRSSTRTTIESERKIRPRGRGAYPRGAPIRHARGGRAMGESELPGTLQDELRAACHRSVELTAPLRPALHAYCRRLTGNLWDAEDLVQDALLRAFGTLGHISHEIASPRAYLLRTATN